MKSIWRFLLPLGLLLGISAANAGENVLTVYTYDSFSSEWGPGPKIKQLFEERCGCKLRFVAVDSSTGILSRVRLEGRGSPADIVLGLDTSLAGEAEKTGLLAPHGLELPAQKLPLDWRSPVFVPFDYGYFAFVYNSERTPNPPASFEALLNAPESLKIIIQDPRSSTPGLGLLLWIKSIYGERAEEVWRRLAPRIVTVTKGWSEAWGLFLDGEADMVLSYTTSPAYKIIVDQEPQYHAAAFEEGHYMQIELAAKLKNAPHPDLADRFLAFIQTPEFQSAIPTGNWMYPVIDIGDALPEAFGQLIRPAGTLLLPSAEVTANRGAWVSEFTAALSR
ncbi:MAG: thiamine ABC transporter substrate binding subunit [Pseudomonadota bacterium]|nr:thiamine ABC transporter substrate binding subunit [Pseudomonadota bacterium]